MARKLRERRKTPRPGNHVRPESSRGKTRPAGPGRRFGSGKYGEPTKPVRVPESKVLLVQAVLAKGGIWQTADKWHDDLGACIWWRWQADICRPELYWGDPTFCVWDKKPFPYTHFTTHIGPIPESKA